MIQSITTWEWATQNRSWFQRSNCKPHGISIWRLDSVCSNCRWTTQLPTSMISGVIAWSPLTKINWPCPNCHFRRRRSRGWSPTCSLPRKMISINRCHFSKLNTTTSLRQMMSLIMAKMRQTSHPTWRHGNFTKRRTVRFWAFIEASSFLVQYFRCFRQDRNSSSTIATCRTILPRTLNSLCSVKYRPFKIYIMLVTLTSMERIMHKVRHQ